MSCHVMMALNHPGYFFLILIIHLTIVPFTSGKLVKHVFAISYIEGSPDGVYKEKIFAINGSFPGPTIEADLGDTLQVDVINLIQDGQNVTLHWHGIHQRGSPFEDGASMVSQCPLKNGFTQRYKFELRQGGTFWYHSHVQSQYSEGLWGVLIVHNKPEVYKYDEEVVITLHDWYHRSSEEIETWHLSPPARGVPPYPDSGMINGLGRYPCTYAKMQNRSCDPDLQFRPVFNVKRNRTYRLRVISTSSYATFNFSIEGHSMKAIEVDGVDVASPVECNIAMIAAGQRYSFLVAMNNENPRKDRFLIRADVRKESLLLLENININKYPEALIGDVTAILKYTDDNGIQANAIIDKEPHSYLMIVPPRKLLPYEDFLDETKLSPFDGYPAPPLFDKRVILEAGFYEDEENIRRGSFNKTPFKLPDHKPLLMTLLEGEDLPLAVFSVEVEYMDVVEVVINNPFYGPHPFHLHGGSFWVLGSGPWFDGNFDPERHDKLLTLRGPRRETVMVQEQSWAVIRFIADNPGVWIFHCHIDWHALSGMTMTFVVGKEQARKNVKVTEEARKVCGYHGISLGQNKSLSDSSSVKVSTILIVLTFSLSIVPNLCNGIF